jgi:hypothetical protein
MAYNIIILVLMDWFRHFIVIDIGRLMFKNFVQWLKTTFTPYKDLQKGECFMYQGTTFVFVKYGEENSYSERAIKCFKVGDPTHFYYVPEFDVMRINGRS